MIGDNILDENLIPDDWQDELDNDFPFQTVNIRGLVMKEGYSTEKIESDYFRDIMMEELLNGFGETRRRFCRVTHGIGKCCSGCQSLEGHGQ
jgi:hypothetical protein